MKLIFCLGNPGIEYKHSRHNIGFMVADALIKSKNPSQTGSRFNSYYSSIDLSSESLVIKPKTFMNNSGLSVVKFFKKYYPQVDDVLVIHDDMDIPRFTLRFKNGGSSAGHRGIQSIIDHIGRDDFARMRIGIGRPPGRQDPVEFVLERFSREESEGLMDLLDLAVSAVEYWANEGIQGAMNRFNNT